MWCWHRWSRWEQYEQSYCYRPPVPEGMWHTLQGDPAKFDLQKKRLRERRHCEQCGRTQDHIVTELFA